MLDRAEPKPAGVRESLDHIWVRMPRADAILNLNLHESFAIVQGLAKPRQRMHWPRRTYRVTDAIRQGFAGEETFEGHVSSTALVLKRTVEKLLAGLQASNPTEYRNLMRPPNYTSDLVQLAVAQMVRGQPMLGFIELRRNGAGNSLMARTVIGSSRHRQDTEIFYLGYWEHIKPYVAASGRPRSVGSAASIDRLIRLEIDANPNEVSNPINILELTGSGARWLQNGGNCSLPGVGW
jgi:hypothetical protein